LARELALKDPSEDVRRVAAAYIGRVRDQVDPFPILLDQLQKDPSPCVKVMACDSIGFMKDERALEPLRAAVKLPDVYVQRAAARALCELGQEEGIGVLIESLTFPSIDAFWNYGRNVPNSIAAYCGTDLPGNDRYEQEKWREWFNKNRGKIDVRANVAEYVEFNDVLAACQNAPLDERVRMMDALYSKYPKSERIRKTLADMLNGAGYTMVTAPKGSPSHDPGQGLKYAMRAAELDPTPEIMDTLAEAYIANGRIGDAVKLCREMLKTRPTDGNFLEKLERCKKTDGGK
jgi:hypothetical protein